jgi:hypothetical protein
MAAQDHGAVVDAAERSAKSWLELTDSERYGESWDEAARLFQSNVRREKWQTAMESVRAPLGALQSRKLQTASYTTELPNAPNGEYVVLQYRTSFRNLNSALETVTAMKEVDGTWKVSGYYIRPLD